MTRCNNGGRNILLMDKETLLRLAQPAATFSLALSVATLPMTVKAYGENVYVNGYLTIDGRSQFASDSHPVRIECVRGCD